MKYEFLVVFHSCSIIVLEYRMAYMPKWNEDISIGNDIQPMLCQRTSFQTALSDVVDRHQKFAGDSADKADYLALKFPGE